MGDGRGRAGGTRRGLIQGIKRIGLRIYFGFFLLAFCCSHLGVHWDTQLLKPDPIAPLALQKFRQYCPQEPPCAQDEVGTVEHATTADTNAATSLDFEKIINAPIFIHTNTATHESQGPGHFFVCVPPCSACSLSSKADARYLNRPPVDQSGQASMSRSFRARRT
jgi:hypothetical protein